MKEEPLVVAVQVEMRPGRGSGDVTLSTEERGEITEELSKDLQVRWLPQVTEEEIGATFAEEITILVYVLGLAFASLGALFLKSAAQEAGKEAGKDFWALTKKLVSRIWKKQRDRSHRLHGKAVMIFELGEEFVGVVFTLRETGEEEAAEKCAEVFEHQARELGEQWSSIASDIDRFSLGRERSHVLGGGRGGKQSRMHLITKLHGKWMIHPRGTWDAFKRGELMPP